MKELQVFQNSEFGKLEVLTIEGKEYFPATACARVLGYVNPWDAVKRHCKLEGCVKHEVWVKTGVRADGSPAMRESETNYITEGNLYRLIVSSKLPNAERFERWVFDEVLPTIRKNGNYGNFSMEQLAQIIQMTATAVGTEMIKQILPLMQQSTAQATINISDTTTRPRRRNGKVDQLPRTLRDVVDSMLLDGTTYRSIVDHLDYAGFPMSQMAISTYYTRGALEGKF